MNQIIEIFFLSIVNGQFSPMIEAQLQAFDEIYDFSTKDFLTTSTTTTGSPITTTETTTVQRVRNQIIMIQWFNRFVMFT